MKFPPVFLALVALCSHASIVSAYDSVVVINEINYHPPVGQSEWVELRNNQGVDVNLAGWKLTGGIDFTFPATGTGSFIPGGGFLVIAAVPGQVAGSIGPFTGTLNNAGDTVRLRNLNDRIMDEVNYGDGGDWPVGADGSGATLARRSVGAAESGAGAWAASTQIGGTPNGENFSPIGQTQRNHIGLSDTWKYRDADAAPPVDWNLAAYDDTTWSSGAASLGAQAGSSGLTVTATLIERFRASDITGVANGGVVATWTDTANGAAFGDAVAQNATGANNPVLITNGTANGKAVVRFPSAGTGEMRTAASPGIGGTSGWTIYMVLRANAVQTNGLTTDGAGNYILDRNITGFSGNPLTSIKAVGGKYGLQKRTDANTGLGGPASLTGISQTQFQIVTIRRNRTQNRFEIWVDGAMEGTAIDDGTALTPSPFVIAHHATQGSTQGFIGDIAEVLVYKSELTDTEFQRVGGYLENEYALNTAFQGVNTPLSATAPTAYFRKAFNFPGDPLRTILRLNHTVADGAVFYLNGTEILRANMPAGPVTHTTNANSIVANPASSGNVSVPTAALVSGQNVLAVELHKGAGGTSSYFATTLESIELPPLATTGLRLSEIAGASDAAFFIELQNTSSSAVSTGGWTLTTSGGQSFAIPAQSLAAGARISFSAAALGFTPADGDLVYLTGPGGTTLGDARNVTSRLRGLLSNGVWGHPTTPTPGAANVAVVSQDVVINEIFYKAISGPEQWIELYNKGGAPVDISGWKFSDGVSFTFASTPATVIPAGGYLVLAWDKAAFAALHPAVSAAITYGPWSGSLSGGGELITLRDANDNIADQLRYYSDGRWSEWAGGGGSSLELKNPNADNSVAEAWDSSDESLAADWQTITYSGLGANATTNAAYTYYNEFCMGLLDDGEVLVDDIVLSETTSGGITRSQLIQNGNFSGGTAATWRNIGTHQFSTVVDDPFSPGNKVLKIVARGAVEHMHNNCSSTVKDGATYVALSTTSTYTISFRAKWLRGTNRLHSRLYFNRLPKQTLLNRPTTGGTPGAQNSRFVANLGPMISNLSVVPVVPLVGQACTVSVSAADSDGIASAELLTSLNGAAFVSTPMTLTNGQWTAVISGQASGASIQFYLRSTDLLGAIATYPANGSASRMMIPWEDGRSILTMPSGAKPHNVRVVMTAADANDMYLSESVMSNYYRPCTFIIDDARAYYLAGTRLKSSEHGRFQQNRVGWNVKFGSDDAFLGAHTTISIDRSGNASNEGLDGTSITSQREILLKTVMNSAGGIYSQEDDLIRVIPTIAAGSPAPAFTGTGALGEAILSKSRFDDEYLDGQWDNGGSGPIFKQEYIYPLTQTINPSTRALTTIAAAGNLDATSEQMKVPETGGSPGPAGIVVQAYTPAPTGNVNFTIDAKENYRWHWLIRNARSGDDYSGIINAITAVGQAQGTPAFKTQTEAALEVDTWLRSSAVPMMFMVTDNYLGSGATHNFLLYFPPGQKGVAIPWDCDFLGQTTANATAWSMTNGGNIAKYIADGANKRRYWCHVLDILNRSFNDAFLTRWATHYSRFGVDDTTSSLPVLRLRANYLRDIIMGTNVSGSNAALTRVIPLVTFAVTTPGPITSATPFTTIAGNGWLDIDRIRIQGSTAPLAVTWTTESAWSVQLPVNAGTNTYVLEAVRKDGTVASTTSIQVTGTGGVFPAGPGNLIASEIHFNPPGPTDSTEFIELLNITTATLNLAGCHFDDNGQGIAFTFPANYTIPAGGRVLVVRDAAAFAAAYPGAGPVAGTFVGALDNGGEEIVLFSASGQEIFRFTYPDNLNSTDGGGKSLVRVIGCVPNPNDYTWRPSIAIGGNPGTSDALTFAGNPLADLDNDSHSALIEYAFGASDNVFNPASDFLHADGENAPNYVPLPNADCAILTLEGSDDLVTWTAVAPLSPPTRRYWRLRATLR